MWLIKLIKKKIRVNALHVTCVALFAPTDDCTPRANVQMRLVGRQARGPHVVVEAYGVREPHEGDVISHCVLVIAGMQYQLFRVQVLDVLGECISPWLARPEQHVFYVSASGTPIHL